MSAPIELTHEGVKILVHERGCDCKLVDHSKFGFGPEGRTALLSTYDADAGEAFNQVWHRGSRWTLREALDALIARCGSRTGTMA